MAVKTRTDLVYYSGDLFETINSLINNNNTEKNIIVPNISNITTNIQTRFFKTAIAKYPIIQETTFVQQHKLGQNSFIKVARKGNSNIYFCQMFCDKPNKYKNINYIHLVNCMIDVRNFCINLKRKEDKIIEIHAPKFGVGISGGRWSTISDLIEDCWYGIPTFVYKDN
jgi:hypothetical protein